MAEFLQAFVKWWIAGPHLDVRARRRLLHAVGLVLLVLALSDPMVAPMLATLDLGFLYSLDFGLLLELGTLLYVLAVRDNGRALVQAVRHVPGTMRAIFQAARRGFARARRTAGRVLKLPGAGDEDGAGAGISAWVEKSLAPAHAML